MLNKGAAKSMGFFMNEFGTPIVPERTLEIAYRSAIGEVFMPLSDLLSV